MKTRGLLVYCLFEWGSNLPRVLAFVTSRDKDARDPAEWSPTHGAERIGCPRVLADHRNALGADAEVLARKENLVGLVVHADLAHAGHGISGAPGAEVLFFDDVGDDDFDWNSNTGEGSFAWDWNGWSGDGVVLGSLEGQFCVTLDVTSSSGMDGYTIISADGSTQNIDDYDAPLVLCGNN